MTCQELIIGREILVENPTLSSMARANVVWISAKRTPGSPHEAGIQLVEPQDIWGVEFPPDEWPMQGNDLGAAAKEAPAPRSAPAESAPAKTPAPVLTSEAIATQMTSEETHEKVKAEALPMLRLMAESEIGAARERVQAQMHADAGQALDGWKRTLDAERDALLNEARQQLTTAITSAIESLNRERDACVTEMKRQIQEALLANEENAVSQIKSKLDATAENHGGTLVERLNETVREIGEKQAALLQSQLDALFANRLDQAQQHVQPVVESLQACIKEGLRIAAEERSRELQARLQDTADSIVASSSSQTREQVEESAKAVAEKSLQDWQEQLRDIASKTVASSSDQIRARVDESAKASAEKALQTWQAKLQELSIHSAASSSEQIQKQMEEALSLLGPKLQEMQERAVSDAMEAFRARLSQFLGMIPASGNR